MSHLPLLNADQELKTPRGHTIGFIDSIPECDALTAALNQSGLPTAAISVWRGEEGVRLLEQMLDGSLWGESAEQVLKQGTLELRNGHSGVCVEVQDAREAAVVAEASKQHGCHGVYHFGDFVDTRLTA